MKFYVQWIVLIFLLPAVASARIKIYFWHSMAGALGIATEQIVHQFNQSQPRYDIIPVYKGNYAESLTTLVAAFRAGQQPQIAQVFEVGTATMTNPKGIVIPVYQLMHDTGVTIDTSDIIPAVRGYYSDEQGRLLGMPFNSSSAVLYYNKAAFKKAGLNPNNPPKTWPELAKDALKLRAAGIECGFTTTWPSWIQIETFSAWHNLPLATADNGFGGLQARVTFNNHTVINQLSHLVTWQKSGIFRYGGREDNANSLFTSGQCAMLTQSSGSLGNLKAEVSFPLGTAMLPYWPTVSGAPQNTIIGGAALWALSGMSKAQEKGVAEFFKFLTRANIQAAWQRKTGYIPITHAGYLINKKMGYYKNNPGADIALQELNFKPPKSYTRGLRLGNYSEIRDINDQEIEAALIGLKTPTEALNNAVLRDNVLLKQFQENIQPNTSIKRSPR